MKKPLNKCHWERDQKSSIFNVIYVFKFYINKNNFKNR